MSRETVADRFTSEQRAEYREHKRAQQREQVERSVRALLTSEGWRRWARARAIFHCYSFGNCLLIANQAPQATRVAGFRAWQKLGRQVRKGERSIMIMAPMSVKTRDTDGDEADKRLTFFRVVPVFDIRQTDGDPLPKIPREPITGDTHQAYLVSLTAHAASLGFTVEREPLARASGYCDPNRRRIVLASGLKSLNAQVRVLIHELAHAHGVGYEEYGRDAAEVIVETAAVIVCGSIGLDTSGESIPYIADWGEASDLEAIREHAQVVDGIARELERACGLTGGEL